MRSSHTSDVRKRSLHSDVHIFVHMGMQLCPQRYPHRNVDNSGSDSTPQSVLEPMLDLQVCAKLALRAGKLTPSAGPSSRFGQVSIPRLSTYLRTLCTTGWIRFVFARPLGSRVTEKDVSSYRRWRPCGSVSRRTRSGTRSDRRSRSGFDRFFRFDLHSATWQGRPTRTVLAMSCTPTVHHCTFRFPLQALGLLFAMFPVEPERSRPR